MATKKRKAMEVEAKKAARKMKSEASRIVAKLSPPLCVLQSLNSHTHLKDIPTFAQKQLKESMKEVSKAEAHAKDAMSGNCAELKMSIEDAQTMAKDVADVVNMCNPLLAAVEKFKR